MTAILQIYAHYHCKSSFSPGYPIKYSQTYLVTHKYARKGMEWLNYGETLCECVGGLPGPWGQVVPLVSGHSEEVSFIRLLINKW